MQHCKGDQILSLQSRPFSEERQKQCDRALSPESTPSHDLNINPDPAEPGYALPLQNSVDQDQLASEEAN